MTLYTCQHDSGCQAPSRGRAASGRNALRKPAMCQALTSRRPIPCLTFHRPMTCLDTQKVLSNVPQDIKCSAPRRRKMHDNSMYYFACRCTNEVIHANSMYLFEIASKTMHTEELAAAKPPPTLRYASTLMRFRKIHAISMYNFICAATCEIIHAIIACVLLP